MAGHGKVCPGFLFYRLDKTANLNDNKIHVTAETIFFPTFYDSGKDCNFQALCDSVIQ